MINSSSSEIQNTEKTDADFIFHLFDASITYQEKNGHPVWKNYDKNAIIRDIENKNQYKVIINATIAMVFSVCYADRIIWRAMDKNDSVYLHRIVVNPECKGQKLFGIVLNWTVEHARKRNSRFIRMDTWAANLKLVQYYQNFGFRVIENFTTPDSPELPVHNRNLPLTLLEYSVK